MAGNAAKLWRGIRGADVVGIDGLAVCVRKHRKGDFAPVGEVPQFLYRIVTDRDDLTADRFDLIEMPCSWTICSLQ